MIQVDSLTRRFGATPALVDLTFQVAAGEVVGFLGPNGAGKTTAMRILTCSLAPSGGTATVGGDDVVADPVAVRRRIGFMPENVPLYPDNTVRELLRFVGRLKSVPGPDLESHLDRIEAETGLTEVRGRLIGHLSRGYRQRVGLAQALVGDPPVLILDEPSVGLDPQQRVQIRELIRRCRGRRTVLLSSHILAEVSQVCERVLILNRGRLVAEQSPEILARRLGSLPVVSLRWSGPRPEILAALGSLPAVQAVRPTDAGAEVTLVADREDVRPSLAGAVKAHGGRLQGMQDRSASLEDLFLQLTADREENRP